MKLCVSYPHMSAHLPAKPHPPIAPFPPTVLLSQCPHGVATCPLGRQSIASTKTEPYSRVDLWECVNAVVGRRLHMLRRMRWLWCTVVRAVVSACVLISGYVHVSVWGLIMSFGICGECVFAN